MTLLLDISVWLTVLGLAQPQSVPADTDTSPFRTLYRWKQLDFEFPSPIYRSQALASRKFMPDSIVPLGIEVWGSRIFLTIISGKTGGVPATLATIPRYGGLTSPTLKPYPDWSFHTAFSDNINCSRLTTVYRTKVDQCGRLWAVDSGQIDFISVCRASVVVFDLKTDRLIGRYEIPEEYVLQDTLYINIVVDSRQRDCSDLHLYMADPWRRGLLVFRERDQKFWRFSHHLFYPEPLAANLSIHGVTFHWIDGIFGLALTPEDLYGQRLLYFNALSSYREFYVSTSVLRQPARVNNSATEFHLVGQSRGLSGQVSTAAIDRRGVMFYGLITRDSIGCWNSHIPYLRRNTGIVAMNTKTLVFPNDLKIDDEPRQNIWVLTNRLPILELGQWDKNDYNFHVLYADTVEAVRGTVCDPITPTRVTLAEQG